MVMTAPQSKSITIRGIRYPSQRAAARALGVCDAAISQAKDEGRLDAVATGERRPHRGKCVEVDGITYPSIRAMSRALGITYGKAYLIAESMEVTE